MSEFLTQKYSTQGDPVIGLVPRGRQLLRAVAFGRGQTSRNNHPMIKLRVIVVASAHDTAVGRTMMHRITLMEDARLYITEALRAFNRGEWEGRLDDDKVMKPLMLGKLIVGHVIHTTGDGGKVFANIDRLEAATATEIKQHGDVPWARYKDEEVTRRRGAGSGPLQPNVAQQSRFTDDDIPF